MAWYEYLHRPGYGRDDHLADELIARAARHLGMAGADKYIAAAVGLASHPVPLGSAAVRMPVSRGVRVRMVAALRRARGEFRRSPDCYISVVCRRTRTEATERVIGHQPTRWATYTYVVLEERRGRDWIPVATTDLEPR